MASIVNLGGEQVDAPPSPVDPSDEQIARFQEILMVRWRRKRVPIRTMAKILNMSKSEVGRRLNAIPENVERHYLSRTDLGF
jgi:hypothetical protein